MLRVLGGIGKQRWWSNRCSEPLECVDLELKQGCHACPIQPNPFFIVDIGACSRLRSGISEGVGVDPPNL